MRSIFRKKTPAWQKRLEERAKPKKIKSRVFKYDVSCLKEFHGYNNDDVCLKCHRVVREKCRVGK